MKIGIAILTAYRFDSLDSVCGGEYRYLLQIAEVAKDLGHEVIVLVESANKEFDQKGIKFRHYDEYPQVDVIITQSTHIFHKRYSKLKDTKCILFSLGNVETSDPFDHLITYNPSVYLEEKKRATLIYPFAPEIEIESKNKNWIVSSSTELYPHLRFELGVEIFKRVREVIPDAEYFYFYQPKWLRDFLEREEEEGKVDYLKGVVLPIIKSPPTGFYPTPMKEYKKYQYFLKKSGFYLSNRDPTIQLSLHEAMAHGTIGILVRRPYLHTQDFTLFEFDIDDNRKLGAELIGKQISQLMLNSEKYRQISQWQKQATRRHRSRELMKEKVKQIL